MGDKSSPKLTLSFLLMAVLCLEALIIERVFYCPSEKTTWTEAKQYCQKNHTDLVTWNTVNGSWLAKWLMEIEVKQVWIGLLRDTENDSVWKWINLKTGVGISGDDVSQSSSWADGQQSRHCALVSDNDEMWQSTACSSEYGFYCSVRDTVQYHKIPLSWHNASHYCQDKNSELATITQKNTDNLNKTGWIGLYREAGETWSWIGYLSSDYRNWAQGEPRNADCASFDAVTEKWHSNVCSNKLQFVCYDDNLVVINDNKTWEEALSHCQNLKTPCVDASEPCWYRHNLLSLEYLSDYNYIRDWIYGATTDEVWMGLRFLGGEWWWVDGQKLKDKGMLPDCPSQWKHCGTLSKYDTNNWTIRDCSERRNFICYKKKILRAEENPTAGVTSHGQD